MDGVRRCFRFLGRLGELLCGGLQTPEAFNVTGTSRARSLCVDATSFVVTKPSSVHDAKSAVVWSTPASSLLKQAT